ncbi:lipoprotein [Sporosarcina sp. NCCP-2222]|uniref:SCO family protein n=1 Tax=Sporosarcina sp. NCCP-2222 TaxID=2935073 RepID=UPI00208D45FA|nr:SCO family protein [Sporosarcina sp. NCCP-2222]GKV54707.1 lipoprotein [Sporosarcina sp. NCCP-2222]
MMNKKWISVLMLFFVLSGCGGKNYSGPSIPPFAFTDQDGHEFGTEQLQDKIWIASFIFTKCETVCTPMTSEMADLQKVMREEDLDVEFVSFTVDPTVDSPELLKQYVGQFTDDESNWHMLTGYSQKDIEEMAVSEFQTIVQKPKTSSQVIHGTNFYLIDREGYIVDEYNYVDDEYVKQIIRDIKKLR